MAQNGAAAGGTEVATSPEELAAVAEEREDQRDLDSTASRLEDWRQAERESSALDQESVLGRLARRAANRARELFHMREGEAREDEAERRATHPGEPLDRR